MPSSRPSAGGIFSGISSPSSAHSGGSSHELPRSDSCSGGGGGDASRRHSPSSTCMDQPGPQVHQHAGPAPSKAGAGAELHRAAKPKPPTRTGDPAPAASPLPPAGSAAPTPISWREAAEVAVAQEASEEISALDYTASAAWYPSSSPSPPAPFDPSDPMVDSIIDYYGYSYGAAAYRQPSPFAPPHASGGWPQDVQAPPQEEELPPPTHLHDLLDHQGRLLQAYQQHLHSLEARSYPPPQQPGPSGHAPRPQQPEVHPYQRHAVGARAPALGGVRPGSMGSHAPSSFVRGGDGRGPVSSYAHLSEEEPLGRRRSLARCGLP